MTIAAIAASSGSPFAKNILPRTSRSSPDVRARKAESMSTGVLAGVKGGLFEFRVRGTVVGEGETNDQKGTCVITKE